MTTAKKANGLGSVRETATGKYRWEVMVDGRRFSGTVATKRAAQQAISTKIAEGARGGIVDPSSITLGEYLTQWLAGKEQTRAVRTNAIQQGHLTRYINPLIGHKRLQRLSPADLRHLFNHLNAKRLGASSQRQVHQFLVSALGEAYRLELIQRNVAELVRPNPPRGSEQQRFPAFTAEQASKFVEVCQQFHRAEGRAFIFALSTGLRRGELCGLRWQDVDFEGAAIQVVEVLAEDKGGPIVTTPKTVGSRRTVYLSPSAVEILREQQQAEAIQREYLSQPVPGHNRDYQRKRQWTGGLRVFTNTTGGALDPSNLNRVMQTLCVNAGVPRLSVHGLRHTYASLSLMRGVPIEVVSKQLGHASPAFTLSQYRWVYTSERKAWALGLAELTGAEK